MCLAPQRISDTLRLAQYALAATGFPRLPLKNNFSICQTVRKPRMFADAMDRRGLSVEGEPRKIVTPVQYRSHASDLTPGGLILCVAVNY